MLESIEQRLSGLVGQILVEVVVDLDHGGVCASTQALDFGHGEKAVLGGLAMVDAEGVLARLHDGVAVAEHAGSLDLVSWCLRTRADSPYRRADLDVVLAHGVPVVHGVEGGDLVHSHRGHLQYPRNLVHDADAGKSVLSLSEVKKRHDGGLLVVGGVPRDNLLDELLVLCAELEGNRRVVLRAVAVLRAA